MLDHYRWDKNVDAFDRYSTEVINRRLSLPSLLSMATEGNVDFRHLLWRWSRRSNWWKIWDACFFPAIHNEVKTSKQNWLPIGNNYYTRKKNCWESKKLVTSSSYSASRRAVRRERNSALECNCMVFVACLENHVSCNWRSYWFYKDTLLYYIWRVKMIRPLKHLVLPQAVSQTEICIDSNILLPNSLHT